MERIVDFEKYCKTCRYYETNETEDPCNECLTEPVREDSRKPAKYSEDTGVKVKKNGE